MQKKRVYYIDIAGGILIIWVMAFHALSNAKVFGDAKISTAADPRVVLPYLTFAMPWFYYKSGQFFNKARGVEGIKKDFKKLIVTFIKWSIPGYLVYLAILLIKGNLTMQTGVADALHTFYIYGYIPIDVPAWFLLSLFVVRLVSHYLIKWNVPSVIPMLGGLVIGYLFYLFNDMTWPFPIANIAMGITFFMVGYQFSCFETQKWTAAMCAIIYLTFLVLGPSIVGHHRNVLLEGQYLLWPLFACSGIVTFNNLCRVLEKYCMNLMRPFAFLGRNTLFLLVAHAFIYMPISEFSTLSPWGTLVLIFTGYVMVFVPLLILKRRRSAR